MSPEASQARGLGAIRLRKYTDGMPRVRLADVAAAAGVSVATASRALAGHGDLRDETRRAVRDAAAALGYVAGGRRGRERAAQHVDLVLKGFDGRWAGEATTEVRAAASARGLDLVLTEDRDAEDDDWTDRVCARGSRGVVLGVIRPTAAQIARLRAAGIPLVLLEPRSDDALGLSSVSAADEDGAAAAADHLVERGAESFALAVPTPAYRYGRARARGFTERLAARLPDASPQLIPVGFDAVETRRTLRAALTSASGRLGLFAATDEIAVQAYLVASDLGIRIPDDLLVVGFDDVPGSSIMIPPLTTVHQPLRRMAARALDLLLDPPPAPASVVLGTALVVRGST